MPPRDQFDKLTHRLTHDKRLVLVELAALGLLGYKSRIWEDPGLRRVGRFVTLIGSRAKEKTTGWVEIQTARTMSLDELLASEEGKGNQNDLFLALKSRLETALGGTASSLVAQVRSFGMGEEPSWRNRARKVMTGYIYSLRAPTSDGSYASVDEITIEQSLGLSDPRSISRFKRVLERFNDEGEPA